MKFRSNMLTNNGGEPSIDTLSLGIALSAILMFLGTSMSVIPQYYRSIIQGAVPPSSLLFGALTINIALIFFGLRHYRNLRDEMKLQRVSEARARSLADTDLLTGCLNRRSFLPLFDEFIASARDNNREIGVAIVDLDNFKQVNDLFGFNFGDTLLQEVAHKLKMALPEGSLLARLGGDEFACAVQFEPSDVRKINHVANTIITTLSNPMTINSIPTQTTVSVGIISVSSVDLAAKLPRAEALVQSANIAMLNAKSEGRNRYSRFEQWMDNENQARGGLEDDIRRAVTNWEFVPYYEQQIDLKSGKIVGFEMLARWESPKHGLVMPNIFIPIAEKIGVIGALSDQLIASALADALKWPDELTLSVNISPIQLRDPLFAQKLLKQMVVNNFPPQRLEVEITESCLHQNMEQVRAIITSLQNQGVKISLDDFGTGYASLAQLRSLQFDRLKIDRSFVCELRANNSSNGKLVDGMILLGDGLGLPITAEGIEDEQILEALRERGSLKGQGYHYGRPENAEAVMIRLGLKEAEEKPDAADAEAPSADNEIKRRA